MNLIRNYIVSSLKVFLLIVLFLFTSCGFDRYNAVTDKTEDLRKGDEYVYGDGNGKPARQTKNTYPDNPEDAKRAEAIREKMFGSGNQVLQETSPVPTDSTKVETKPEAEKKEEKKAEPKKI